MSWIAIRSELLHKIICEIEPRLGLIRVRERGRTDIVELGPYGMTISIVQAVTQSTS